MTRMTWRGGSAARSARWSASRPTLGIDVVNDGEHSKSSFAHYARSRIGGFERRNEPSASRGADPRRAGFPGVYDEMRVMFAARPSKLGRPRGMMAMVCTGPIKYIGQERAQGRHRESQERDRRARRRRRGSSPRSRRPTSRCICRNEYYRSDEDYLVALADAMNEEYRAIVDAGFLLQIDDPRLITYYNRTPGLSLEDNRKFIALRRGYRQPRAARHTRGSRALPYLLQHQCRAARS